MVRHLMGTLAEWERERASERTREVKRYRKSHLLTYGPVAFGLTRDKDRLRVDPETFPVVQQILRWHRKGVSYHRIARRLNKKGVPTKRGGHWYAASVKNIVANRTLYKEVETMRDQ